MYARFRARTACWGYCAASEMNWVSGVRRDCASCDNFFFQAEDGIRDYKVTGVQTCALPICSITDVPDAVAEIERIAGTGLRALLLPATPPRPYHLRDYDPIWSAASANGMQVFLDRKSVV